MKINYDKKIKYYPIGKMPKKQALWTLIIEYIGSKISLMGTKYKIEKFGKFKPPFLLLINHSQFVDFYIDAIATWPHRTNPVTAIDGYLGRAWVMDALGCIPKHKFVNDFSVVKQISYVVNKLKNIPVLYPEARYSPIGTTAILPDSLGKIAKFLKVPVVVLLNHGNHLHMPFWDYRRKRKVPLYASMKTIITAEETQSLSTEELNTKIREGMQYDDYKYQLENNIQITESFRAEGLHKVLYKCIECGDETSMTSSGINLKCQKCGSVWELKTNGQLNNQKGKTKISHVPDWFEWEREEVRKEIENGTYKFFDKAQAYSIPNPKKLISLGEVTVKHTLTGFKVNGNYNGKDFELIKAPLENYGLHVEYDWEKLKEREKDAFSFSTIEDSFYFVPSKKNIVTKLSFAVEELYKWTKAK